MTDLYFVDDQPLVTEPLFAKIMSVGLAWTGPPALPLPHSACSQGLFEYYTNISKVKCHKAVDHLQSAVWSS